MPNIELLHIDCMEYMAALPDKAFDLIIQDTPFGVTQNKWDTVPDLNSLWPEWLRIGKDNSAYLFFATQPFAADLINSNRKMFRYDLIWYKALGTGFLNANKMPMRNHEHILVFYKQLPTYNPQMYIGKMRDKGNKGSRTTTNYGTFKPTVSKNDKYFPQSVLDFTNGDRTKEADHPTQKPVDLFRYLIKTYSNIGDNIFDGYGGSGTTAIAAHLENRNAVVCELDKDYYDAACKRFKEQTAQLSLL